jgi:hypothetical protein
VIAPVSFAEVTQGGGVTQGENSPAEDHTSEAPAEPAVSPAPEPVLEPEAPAPEPVLEAESVPEVELAIEVEPTVVEELASEPVVQPESELIEEESTEELIHETGTQEGIPAEETIEEAGENEQPEITAVPEEAEEETQEVAEETERQPAEEGLSIAEEIEEHPPTGNEQAETEEQIEVQDHSNTGSVPGQREQPAGEAEETGPQEQPDSPPAVDSGASTGNEKMEEQLQEERNTPPADQSNEAENEEQGVVEPDPKEEPNTPPIITNTAGTVTKETEPEPKEDIIDIPVPHINDIFFDGESIITIDGLNFRPWNQAKKSGTKLLVGDVDEGFNVTNPHEQPFQYVNWKTLHIPANLPLVGSYAVVASNHRQGQFVMSNVFYVDFNYPLPDAPKIDVNSTDGGDEIEPCEIGDDCNGNNSPPVDGNSIDSGDDIDPCSAGEDCNGDNSGGDDDGGDGNNGSGDNEEESPEQGGALLHAFNPLFAPRTAPAGSPVEAVVGTLEEGPVPEIVALADGRVKPVLFSPEPGPAEEPTSPITGFIGSAGMPLLGLGALLVLLGLFMGWNRKRKSN